MSHDHSMFFVIICLCMCCCNEAGFEKLVDYLGPKKKPLFFQQKVYGLERWLTNCSKAKMKGVFTVLLGVWLPPKILETLLGKKSPTGGEIQEL